MLSFFKKINKIKLYQNNCVTIIELNSSKCGLKNDSYSGTSYKCIFDVFFKKHACLLNTG